MLTREEIEYTISETYRLNQATSLRLDNPGKISATLATEALNGATLTQTRITTQTSRLLVPLQGEKPMISMYFQLHGGCTFLLNDTIQVSERRHALCYVPAFLFNYAIDEHTSFHDLTIRYEPDAVATQLLEEGMSDDDWLRMLESSDQVFTNLRQSRQISATMQTTLHQLLNCPYTGKLGQSYKDSLSRLLLIEQLAIFRQNERIELPDSKLTRRDIDTLHDLKSYLERNYLDDLSLDKIAKDFGLNTFKLKYGFKKLFDTSVMRYIDDQKMGYARQLLLDGGKKF